MTEQNDTPVENAENDRTTDAPETSAPADGETDKGEPSDDNGGTTVEVNDGGTANVTSE